MLVCGGWWLALVSHFCFCWHVGLLKMETNPFFIEKWHCVNWWHCHTGFRPYHGWLMTITNMFDSLTSKRCTANEQLFLILLKRNRNNLWVTPRSIGAFRHHILPLCLLQMYRETKICKLNETKTQTKNIMIVISNRWVCCVWNSISINWSNFTHIFFSIFAIREAISFANYWTKKYTEYTEYPVTKIVY